MTDTEKTARTAALLTPVGSMSPRTMQFPEYVVDLIADLQLRIERLESAAEVGEVV